MEQSTMARVLGKARRWAATLALLAGFVLFVMWGLGKAFTDRFIITQGLSWILSQYAVIGLLLLVLARWILARREATPAKARIKFVGSGTSLLVAMAVVVLGYLLVLDWRMWRIAFPAAPGAESQRVRVLVWNIGYVRTPGLAQKVKELEPDVIALTNAHITTDWVGVREAMGRGGPTYTAQQGWFTLISRYPIIRHGWVPLAVSPATWRPFGLIPVRWTSSGGECSFFEIAHPAHPRPFVAWFNDMPSDPLIHRWVAMGQADSATRRFRGPILYRGPDGLDTSRTPPETGFPEPDLIGGDFNTPRRAGSIDRFVRGLTHAYDQASWGPTGSFPRTWPLTHIDHIYVGNGLRATKYEIVDLGIGRHRAQIADVVPK